VLIRDVAYSTLPKSVRARKHAEVGAFIAERAADRAEGVAGMVGEHYGRSAVLGEDAGIAEGELDEISRRAIASLEAAGGIAASLYSNLEALGHYEMALSIRRSLDPATRARIAERLGDVALRLGRVDRAVELWGQCLDYHRREEDLARGEHREGSEADYDGAAEAYGEALSMAERTGDLPSQVELHGSLRQLGVHKGAWEAVEREARASRTLAEREGLVGKLCFPALM